MNLPIVSADDPTLSQAFEQLAADEAEASPAPEVQPESNPDSAKPVETPAPSPADPKTEVQPSPKPDTATPAPESKPAETAPENKSKYQRAIERGFTNWQEFNTWKSEQRKLIESDQAATRTEREKLTAERQAFESERSKTVRKPEDYERFALQCLDEAKALEDKGDFDAAQEREILAKQARQAAKELRENPPKPPPTDEQAQAKFLTSQKEWWGKAAIDFPAVTKKDSPEFSALAKLVNEIPSISKDPQAMYYAARMAVAETAAAGVPALTKELGEARAKIKELTEKLALPGDGVVSGAPKGEVPYEQKSAEEQEADLYREARSIGYLS